MAENGATYRARRVQTLLTSEHEHDHDDDNDHDEDEDEERKRECRRVVAGGDAGREKRENERQCGNCERCSNNRTPASNRPGRRMGWRGAPNCHKQVA